MKKMDIQDEEKVGNFWKSQNPQKSKKNWKTRKNPKFKENQLKTGKWKKEERKMWEEKKRGDWEIPGVQEKVDNILLTGLRTNNWGL